jgi:hypothetical protein
MPKPELQRKCRRLFYNLATGEVMGLASGGGAMESLTGDDLIRATFSFADDSDPTLTIGVIEEFYSPLHGRKPISVDLLKVKSCCDAVDAHRAAKKAEADFIFEKSVKLFGSEQPTTKAFQHALKVQEMYTRDNLSRASDHDDIVQAQTELEILCKDCEDCCEQLLITRDAAITYAAASVLE